ncbi:hypothetical protein Pelo_1457 [Pelomyxa schiedti]|nr:hypothetical protein Pelo_1457 [Pelomyxa schiedti]
MRDFPPLVRSIKPPAHPTKQVYRENISGRKYTAPCLQQPESERFCRGTQSSLDHEFLWNQSYDQWKVKE